MTNKLFVLVLLFCFPCQHAGADDAIDLISGFDRQRIEALSPIDEEAKVGEVAKLIFRLNNVDGEVLRSRADDSWTIGHAVEVDGEIESVSSLKVPAKLVEFLDLSRISVVRVRVGEEIVTTITPPISALAKPGDRVAGVGIVIDPSDRAAAIKRLRWMPSVAPSMGWQLLADAGVDVGMLTDVMTLNRKPLVAADGDAFYAMLAATGGIATRTDVPTPPTFGPVKLLTDARAQVGQWMRLNVETVQITRVAVTENNRRQQLGQDHYFQIDAVADLGDVVIRVETGDDPNDEQAVFENRYPVSIVTLELPAFLAAAAGPNVIVAEVSRMVAVDGFFYRLWSYKTEYMKRFGGAEQFGPLVMAARMVDTTPNTRDPVGVSVIGWIAAAAVLAGLIATIVWHRWTTSGDRAIREKQKRREGGAVTLPQREDVV